MDLEKCYVHKQNRMGEKWAGGEVVKFNAMYNIPLEVQRQYMQAQILLI